MCFECEGLCVSLFISLVDFFSALNFSDKVFSVLLPLGRISSDAISHSWHVFGSKKPYSFLYI